MNETTEPKLDSKSEEYLADLLTVAKQILVVLQQHQVQQIKVPKLDISKPPALEAAKPKAPSNNYTVPKIPKPKMPDLNKQPDKLELSVAPQIKRMIKSLRRQLM